MYARATSAKAASKRDRRSVAIDAEDVNPGTRQEEVRNEKGIGDFRWHVGGLWGDRIVRLLFSDNGRLPTESL